MSTFIAAETTAKNFEWLSGLRFDRGFVQFANGRVGGLYPDRKAREIITCLDLAGVNAHITVAETYAEGMRKTGTRQLEREASR